MIEVKLAYDRDAERAVADTRFWAPLALTPDQKHSVSTPDEMEALADALPIEQVASRWIVTADPDAAVAQIKEYVDAGLNHLVFHGPGHDQRRFLAQLSEDIVPRLRALPLP
jgi:coenzyme F420-dependent glucose-6-phosphate dehydrogenase